MRKEIDSMKNLKWYVLNYDFNAKKVVNYNIFNNWVFTEAVEKAIDEYTQGLLGDLNDLIERIDSLAKWRFWSKREYEISVGDLFEQDIEKYEKIDVYRQLKDNMENLTLYLLDKYHNESE